jgi:hypothetical protein
MMPLGIPGAGPAATGPAALPNERSDPELLESLRRYVRLETERLRMRHRLGLGGRRPA